MWKASYLLNATNNVLNNYEQMFVFIGVLSKCTLNIEKIEKFVEIYIYYFVWALERFLTSCNSRNMTLQFISIYLYIYYLKVTKSVFYNPWSYIYFSKRHLLTLLTLNVAVHSSGSKTLASLRYRRSELHSLRSHRLQNRDVISAIKRFGICAHHFRRRTQLGGRGKQHAIKVIDTGLRTSTCSYTRMDRRNLINVHSIPNSTKTLSGLRVGCFNAQSVQRSCDKRTEISNFTRDQQMDILFITETWLKPHGDEGRLHDLTPAGYIAKSLPRESWDCFIAVAYKL